MMLFSSFLILCLKGTYHVIVAFPGYVHIYFSKASKVLNLSTVLFISCGSSNKLSFHLWHDVFRIVYMQIKKNVK